MLTTFPPCPTGASGAHVDYDLDGVGRAVRGHAKSLGRILQREAMSNERVGDLGSCREHCSREPHLTLTSVPAIPDRGDQSYLLREKHGKGHLERAAHDAEHHDRASRLDELHA